MPNPLLLSNPLLQDLLLKALLPNSLIGMAFLVHLMHLPTIIRIVSLKGLILVGYIRQLKSKTKLGLKGGIDGVVIAIFKKGIEGG
jgi:hypothetical protein